MFGDIKSKYKTGNKYANLPSTTNQYNHNNTYPKKAPIKSIFGDIKSKYKTGNEYANLPSTTNQYNNTYDTQNTPRDSQSISSSLLGIKPSRSKVFVSSMFLPGLGRYIAKQKKSIMPVLIYTGAIVALTSQSIRYKWKSNTYYKQYRQYRNTGGSSYNRSYRGHGHYHTYSYKKSSGNADYSRKMYEKYEKTLRVAHGLMYAAIGVYAINLLDALFLEIEEQGGVAISVAPKYDLGTDTPMLSLNLKL